MLQVEPIEGDDLTVRVYAAEGAHPEMLAAAIHELEQLYVVLWAEGPWDDEEDGRLYYEAWPRR